MSLHFLLKAEVRTRSLVEVLGMSDDDAFTLFRRVRWGDGDEVICPHCGLVHKVVHRTSPPPEPAFPKPARTARAMELPRSEQPNRIQSLAWLSPKKGAACGVGKLNRQKDHEPAKPTQTWAIRPGQHLFLDSEDVHDDGRPHTEGQTIMPAPTVLFDDSSMTMKAPVPRLSA
jgi:hypothetical protein